MALGCVLVFASEAKKRHDFACFASKRNCKYLIKKRREICEMKRKNRTEVSKWTSETHAKRIQFRFISLICEKIFLAKRAHPSCVGDHILQGFNTLFLTRSEPTKLLHHPKQKPRRGGGLRPINTCRIVPLQVNFFRERHLTLLSISLIFLRSFVSISRRHLIVLCSLNKKRVVCSLH